MSFKAVFFKGLRLHHSFRQWNPSTGGEAARVPGVLRKNAVLFPYSPSYTWSVDVDCWVDPIYSAVDADVDVFDTVQLALLQMHKDLIDHSAAGFGSLAYVQDTDRVSSVNGVVSVGLAVIPLTSEGFTPVAGRYVLLVDPTSGEGGVVQVVSYSSPNLTVNLPASIGALDTDWKVYDIAVHWPNARFLNMTHGAPIGVGRHRESVIYSFECQEQPIIASDYQQDLS